MFIQIGDLYINQDHIESIRVTSHRVCIWTDVPDDDGAFQPYEFVQERQAILYWLECKAEVSKVC